MNRAAILLLAITLFGSGIALAQTPLFARPNLAVVQIPVKSVLAIRFTQGTSNSNVALPDTVEFIFTSGTYTLGTFGPTNAAFNWDDIKIFHNDKGDWEVVVSTLGSPGFDWSNIGITPTVAAPYDLGSPYTIEADSGKTLGWRSLGIDPADYRITFDGTEDPGTYTATVIFTLQSP